MNVATGEIREYFCLACGCATRADCHASAEGSWKRLVGFTSKTVQGLAASARVWFS
jgi:hypothetical protein